MLKLDLLKERGAKDLTGELFSGRKGADNESDTDREARRQRNQYRTNGAGGKKKRGGDSSKTKLFTPRGLKEN